MKKTEEVYEQLKRFIKDTLRVSGYANADGTVPVGTRVDNLTNFLTGKIYNEFAEGIPEDSESPIKKKNMQQSYADSTTMNIPPPPPKNAVGIRLDKGSLVPQYATQGSAGFDLVANFVNESDYEAYANKFKKSPNKDYLVLANEINPEDYTVLLLPGCVAPIPTGIYMEIPEGKELQVRPRSGIASKNGLTVINTPGTIDSDYRGEIIVLLYNASKYPQAITQGMKVAQAILAPYDRANFIIKESLSDTVRGDGGFNSTGTNIKQ